MEYPYYEIRLPLPTSINASKTVGAGRRNFQTKKMERVVSRSKKYNEWLQWAAVAYRNRYPSGVRKFTGRLRVDYIFIWNDKDRGRNSSDIGNREKCLSDFLEHKFFDNDNQIDEQHQYRRISANFENCVLLRVYEIPDRRYDPISAIFKTMKEKLCRQEK